jgi:hypothetical protein
LVSTLTDQVQLIDCQQFWQAALQYFQLAQEYYTAGEYALGDYCIARGDTYLRVALRCRQANLRGIAPLLDEEPRHDPEVGTPSLEKLQAKFEQAQRAVYPHVAPVPPVPAEATDSPQCDGYWWTGWGHLDSALHAAADGDNVAYYYYMAEADACLQAYQECEAAVHG